MRLSERNRRNGRLVLGVVLAPLTCLTIALFFTTAGQFPESFTSWTHLGCFPHWMDEGSSVPRFDGLTGCGRAYQVKIQREQQDFTALYNVWTHEKLGEVPNRDGFQRGVISQKKQQFLALTTDSDASRPVLGLRDLVSNKILARLSTDSHYEFCLNKVANAVMIRSVTDGQVWDMANGKRLVAIHTPLRKRSFDFCDSLGHPRSLTISKSIAIWNEETGLKAFDLVDSAVSEEREGALFQISPDCRKVAIEEDGKIQIWSLEDGHFIRSMPVLGSALPVFIADAALTWGGSSRVAFSNMSRWLVRIDELEPSGILVPDFWTMIRWKIAPTSFLGKNVATLVDLETRQAEVSVPVQNGDTPLVAFSEDDSLMATFANDGQYIWTVPPRTRLFTSWAWVALAACTCLFVLWRRLGNKANLNPACPI